MIKNDPNRFYERSDHYNFAKNGISLLYFILDGLHEDYHQPTDDVEKIDFNKLEKVAKYVFLTAWELAYRKKQLKNNGRSYFSRLKTTDRLVLWKNKKLTLKAYYIEPFSVFIFNKDNKLLLQKKSD